VLEEELGDVTTYSVGQVRVAGLVASYCGTQSLTTDNSGATVYFDGIDERDGPMTKYALAEPHRGDPR